MNEQIGNKREGKLSLKWLDLAWFSLIFTTLVISAIAAAAQGDPESVVLKWGNNQRFRHFRHQSPCNWYDRRRRDPILLTEEKTVGVGRRGVERQPISSSNRLCFGWSGHCRSSIPMVETALGTVNISMYWGGRTNPVYLKTALDVILALVGAVLIASVTEEIIFRGYILTMFV